MTTKRGIYEKDKGSGIWWIRWTDQDGHRHREKAGSWSTANTLLKKRHTQILEGRKLPELDRTKVITFDDLCVDAMAHSAAENSPKQTYELGTRIKQIKPVFGDRPADTIIKSEILSWLTEQSKARKWKPASRNRWQATFSLIFRVAMDNEKIQRNPAARIRRKQENNGRVRFLSEAEERNLLATIDRLFPQFRSHVVLAIHTGMRMSEQYSLRWRQVDLERWQLHLGLTKNKQPRVIRLNSVAVSVLNSLLPEKHRGNDPVFPSARTDVSLQGSRGWFPTAVAESGIEHATWHCLRHTFASRLVMAGVDLRTVAELLGHRTLQMVMRYSHLAPEHQIDAVERLVTDFDNRTAAKSATGAFGVKQEGVQKHVSLRRR
jgi:site-specific recombinase XerD